jgi:hypothetical protein
MIIPQRIRENPIYSVHCERKFHARILQSLVVIPWITRDPHIVSRVTCPTTAPAVIQKVKPETPSRVSHLDTSLIDELKYLRKIVRLAYLLEILLMGYRKRHHEGELSLGGRR